MTEKERNLKLIDGLDAAASDGDIVAVRQGLVMLKQFVEALPNV